MTLSQYMSLRSLSIRQLAELSGVDRNAIQRGAAGMRISARNAAALDAYVSEVETGTGITIDVRSLLLGSLTNTRRTRTRPAGTNVQRPTAEPTAEQWARGNK